MQRNIDRRQFLGHAAVATAAVSGIAHVAIPLFGIEPIARNGQPKFKFSLAAYSYRDLLKGEPAEPEGSP